MPQAIQVETQSEQQGLALLHGQQPAGRAGREFAFHRREDALDQSTAPIKAARKCPPHFGSHPAHSPGFLPTFRRDHTLRSESLPDVGVVPLAVEFGIGQHQTDPRLLGSCLHDRRQTRAVVPGAPPSHLCQHTLPVQVNHHDPLQPVPPGQRLLPVMMLASDEEGAHRPRRQAGGIDRHAGPLSPPGHTLPNRRTVSPTARASVASSTRFRKRYSVVKSGTLLNPRASRSSRCSLKRTSASRKVQSSYRIKHKMARILRRSP